ncbi:MAG: ABC transporter permease [Actinobacteria bacterium]|nr:ABC transporter permease [Actinomycetota bacterium]
MLFIAPLLVIIAVTFGKLSPILQTPVPVWNPADWNTGVMSFTISNLIHSDGIYYAAFVRTVIYVSTATMLCLLIGYPFAYFLARHAGRAKGFFLAVFFAPFWVSYMLRMLAWIGLLQDSGYVNRLLMNLGIIDQPYPWLSGKPLTLILGLTYGYVPFMILPLYAALDRIPVSHLEASRDLGASPSRTFFRITLPQSRQAILAGVIIAGLPMFGDYFTQQLLANSNDTMMLGNFVVDSLAQPVFISRGASLILVMMAMMLLPVAYYLRSTAREAAARPTR